jgi:hypothetical protein
MSSPQSFRDVLDPAHRHAGQIHLDQCLLARALIPPVALDDRSRQPHLLGCRGFVVEHTSAPEAKEPKAAGHVVAYINRDCTPSNIPVVGSKALISLATKLPTSRSPPN